MAKILPNHESSVSIAAHALIQNELVAIPTETVYGLAGNATHALTVAKIFSAKERPSFDPLIVHIPSSLNPWKWIEERKIIHTSRIPEKDLIVLQALTQKFWPGPLTLVLPQGENIPDIVTSGLGRVGVRMPDHALTQAVLAECGLPLAAPSANRFGRISPTTAQAVQEELGDRIEFILDGGPSRVGVESTVLLFDEVHALKTQACFQILRPGGLIREEIEKVLSDHGYSLGELVTSQASAPSPGLTDSHYAPRKPTFRISQFEKLPKEILRSKIDEFHKKWGSVSVLKPESLGSDDVEAAAVLFSRLREFDADPHTKAILIFMHEKTTGLWAAIRDRLMRASVEL